MHPVNRTLARVTAKNLYTRHAYSIAEVSKYCGITRQTIVRWISEGKWQRGFQWPEDQRFDRKHLMATPQDLAREEAQFKAAISEAQQKMIARI